LSGVDGARFETSAGLELELWQLWPVSATMAGMSQLWVEIGLGFKQYHKGQENWANKGLKVGLGQQRTNKRPNNCANKGQKYGQLGHFFFFFPSFFLSFLNNILFSNYIS
jgi:hypothetical protein